MAKKGLAETLTITVAASLAPGEVNEWTLHLPQGSTVADALHACNLTDVDDGHFALGIWGRNAEMHEALHDSDRVECCRPLTVDPKLARRHRFASQGKRAAGLFAASRPRSKAGY